MLKESEFLPLKDDNVMYSSSKIVADTAACLQRQPVNEIINLYLLELSCALSRSVSSGDLEARTLASCSWTVLRSNRVAAGNLERWSIGQMRMRIMNFRISFSNVN